MVKMCACACGSTPFLASSSLSLITEGIWPRIEGWLRLPKNQFQKNTSRCSDHHCLCLTRRSSARQRRFSLVTIQGDRGEPSRLKLQISCEGEGDVVGVEAPLGGVAQVIFHGVQVVKVGVQVRVHQDRGEEEDGEVRVEVKGEVEENQRQPHMYMA